MSLNNLIVLLSSYSQVAGSIHELLTRLNKDRDQKLLQLLTQHKCEPMVANEDKASVFSCHKAVLILSSWTESTGTAGTSS